jgi:hypothetical protein
VKEENARSDRDLLVDRRLDIISLILVLLAIPVALALHSAKAAFSIGVGAVLSYINFRWMKQAIDFVVRDAAQSRARGVVFRFIARYALIAIFLYATIRGRTLDVLFVFAGLLVYVAAILVECISEVYRVLAEDYRLWKNNWR